MVGVAAPVIVTWARTGGPAAVENQLKITTTPQVEGSWAWIQHDGETDRRWTGARRTTGRPAPQVHVESNIYGLDFGGGYYGGDNVRPATSPSAATRWCWPTPTRTTSSCSRTASRWPPTTASYGSGDDIGDPNRVTRSGMHVVMDKQETTKMSNPAYGYSDITEHWAVRISNNGEFIHQNQDTVGRPGRGQRQPRLHQPVAPRAPRRTSQSAIYGDPVEVTGTSVPLSAADGDIYDWAIPWDQWQLR